MKSFLFSVFIFGITACAYQRKAVKLSSFPSKLECYIFRAHIKDGSEYRVKTGVRVPSGNTTEAMASVRSRIQIAAYILNMGRYTAMRMNTTNTASATMMAGSSRLSARFTRTSTSLS